MNEQQEFIKKFMSEYELSYNEARDAWRDAELLRGSITIDNAANFLHFINMNTQDKLRWRTLRAEEGIELTPDEVDRYVSLVRYVVEKL